MDTEDHCSFNLYTVQTTNLQLEKYFCIIVSKVSAFKNRSNSKTSNK